MLLRLLPAAELSPGVFLLRFLEKSDIVRGHILTKEWKHFHKCYDFKTFISHWSTVLRDYRTPRKKKCSGSAMFANRYSRIFRASANLRDDGWFLALGCFIVEGRGHGRLGSERRGAAGDCVQPNLRPSGSAQCRVLQPARVVASEIDTRREGAASRRLIDPLQAADGRGG